MVKDFIRKNSYYVILFFLSLLVIIITKFLGLDEIFLLLYSINYININTAFMTIFGIFFAFIFTILAILFSLKEDSLFFQLIQKNNRNKDDVLNYFTLALFFLSLVFLISLFLTITCVDKDSAYLIAPLILYNITALNQILISILVYLAEIAFVNIILLFVVFIAILKS